MAEVQHKLREEQRRQLKETQPWYPKKPETLKITDDMGLALLHAVRKQNDKILKGGDNLAQG